MDVSVLMPAFNAVDTLVQAVASVQSQEKHDWELLIVDDASSDETRAVANKLSSEDARIRVLSHDLNQGPAAARNTGLKEARGRYIAFLDADDLWLPQKLSRQISFMKKQGAALGYSGFWRKKLGGAQSVRREVLVPSHVSRDELLYGNVICCSTAVYDRKQLGDRPMPNLRLRQDFALWLNILAEVEYAHAVTEPLAIQRARPNSVSANRMRATRATWDMYRKYLGLTRSRSALYLGHHLAARLARG